MLLASATPPETPSFYGILGTHKTLRRTPIRRYSSVASCQGQQNPPHPLQMQQSHHGSFNPSTRLSYSSAASAAAAESCRLSSQVSTHGGPKQDKQNDPNRKRVSPCMACSLRAPSKLRRRAKVPDTNGTSSAELAELAEQAEHGRGRRSPCPVWRQRPWSPRTSWRGADLPNDQQPLDLRELTRWRSVLTLKLVTPVTR